MNESKANRISKLEQHKTKSDQKKEYCPCRCHWKTFADFFEISDEYAERVWEIVESFGSFQLPDGSWKTVAEDLQEHIANPPPCTCSCSY